MHDQTPPRPRILIVEDEAIVATDIERCLEDAGFEVAAIAASADDALQEAAREHLDLILMDIRIQGDRDGIEAGHQLHELYRLPIIYLTAHGDRETIERAKKTEPFSFVLKPFNPNELTNTIEITLNRARADSELRDREMSFGSALEAIGDAVFTTDSLGNIRFINRAAEQLTGHGQKEALGRPITEIVNVAEVRTGGSIAGFRSLLGLGGAVDRAAQTDQFCIVGPDGVRRWTLVRRTGITGSDGNFVQIAVLRDITAGKEAEQALQRQADLLELSHEAIFTWEADGALTYWNHGAELLYGFSKEQALGRIVHDLLETRRVSGATDFRLCLAQAGQWRGELHHTTKDGRNIIVDSLMVARGDAPGPKTVLETNRDITERKRAEEEIRKLNAELEQRVRERTKCLEDANTELEAFAYSVSHDLRAPLRGIDGWSLALVEDYSSLLDQRGHEYLGLLRSEAQRMAALIDDLLGLSRVGRAEMQLACVDLSGLAERVAARLRDEYAGRQVEFQIQPGLTATADQGLLEVALTNLLSNAVKFTATRTPAVIKLGQIEAEGERQFFVSDNGVGFDMAYAGVLFAPFQRLHKASEFPGTGIGLATVQRVIHRHGGRVWAQAIPDNGATIYFTIGAST